MPPRPPNCKICGEPIFNKGRNSLYCKKCYVAYHKGYNRAMCVIKYKRQKMKKNETTLWMDVTLKKLRKDIEDWKKVEEQKNGNKRK